MTEQARGQMLQAVLLYRHQQPKRELGKDMGIERFRKETGTFQQSFGKEQSSLSLS